MHIYRKNDDNEIFIYTTELPYTQTHNKRANKRANVYVDTSIFK